jgi:hypothetical protein
MDERKRRWMFRASVFDSWQALDGEHTAKEIWNLRKQKRFVVAIPCFDSKSHATSTEGGMGPTDCELVSPAVPPARS